MYVIIYGHVKLIKYIIRFFAFPKAHLTGGRVRKINQHSFLILLSTTILGHLRPFRVQTNDQCFETSPKRSSKVSKSFLYCSMARTSQGGILYCLGTFLSTSRKQPWPSEPHLNKEAPLPISVCGNSEMGSLLGRPWHFSSRNRFGICFFTAQPDTCAGNNNKKPKVRSCREGNWNRNGRKIWMSVSDLASRQRRCKATKCARHGVFTQKREFS